MAIDIIALLAYEGPNVFGPQPGVLVRVRSDHDYSRRLKDAFKDGAQYIGLVIGYLDVKAVRLGERWLISANCTTPMPAIAFALAEYVIEGLRVEEARAEHVAGADSNDDEGEADEEEWDRDTPLYNLQRRRRTEAPPLPVLQLEAEARVRDLPFFRREDGRYQIGYGAQSWMFGQADLALAPPWERLGRVPIIAIAGESGRSVAISQLQATLDSEPIAWSIADDASFAATHGLLSDPHTHKALIGLSLEGIATQGLSFDHCTRSAITDLGLARPPEILDDQEWAQTLGVPILVTDPNGFTVLNADEPLLAALARYAPCPVVFVSAHNGGDIVAAHRAAGGAALFVRGTELVAVIGAQERILGPAPAFAGVELIGALAAQALLLDWREWVR